METIFLNLPGEERYPQENNNNSTPIYTNATISAYLFSYLKLEIVKYESGRFGRCECKPKYCEPCDPWNREDVPYYMPHSHCYPTCSSYTGCKATDVGYNSGSAASEPTKKEVEIYTGKRYKISFYNDGFYNTVTGIVNEICADPDDVISGYINFTAFDPNCNNITACTSGTKISIGIGNIQDVEEVEEDTSSDTSTSDEGEIKVMILGITATTFTSIIIRLGLIDDDPDNATTYVDMEVGKKYHVVFEKNNTIYEIDGTLLDIKQIAKYWSSEDKQFVRSSGDYKEGGYGKYPGANLYDPRYCKDSKAGRKIYEQMPNYNIDQRRQPPVPGMFGVPYEELSDQDAFLSCDKNNIDDLKLTFNTGADGYPCYETVLLSQIRNCCELSECPCPPIDPCPPLNPDQNSFEYNVENYCLTFVGTNIDKVILAKGKEDEYGIMNEDIIETVKGIEDNKEYSINIPNDGLYTLAVYYRCVCPISFFNFTVDSNNTASGNYNEHHHHHWTPCPPPPCPPPFNPDTNISVSADDLFVTFTAQESMNVVIYDATNIPDEATFNKLWISGELEQYRVYTYMLNAVEDITGVTEFTFNAPKAGKYCYSAFNVFVGEDGTIYTVSAKPRIGFFTVVAAGYEDIETKYINAVRDMADYLTDTVGISAEADTSKFPMNKMMVINLLTDSIPFDISLAVDYATINNDIIQYLNEKFQDMNIYITIDELTFNLKNNAAKIGSDVARYLANVFRGSIVLSEGDSIYGYDIVFENITDGTTYPVKLGFKFTKKNADAWTKAVEAYCNIFNGNVHDDFDTPSVYIEMIPMVNMFDAMFATDADVEAFFSLTFGEYLTYALQLTAMEFNADFDHYMSFICNNPNYIDSYMANVFANNTAYIVSVESKTHSFNAPLFKDVIPKFNISDYGNDSWQIFVSNIREMLSEDLLNAQLSNFRTFTKTTDTCKSDYFSFNIIDPKGRTSTINFLYRITNI